MLVLGRDVGDGRPRRITFAAGEIARVDPAEDVSGRAPWVAPGFVDIQVNGYGGQEFSSLALTVERVPPIVAMLFSHGVTRFCPTLTTAGEEVLLHGLRTLERAREASAEVRAAVLGYHIEGPFISAEDGPRGAHPRAHCRPPDWDEFQRWQAAAGGQIVLVTLAPEYDGAAEFIAQVVAAGVVVAIGHTAANSEQIARAVDAGARLSTHLGNGAHRELRRHPNYIWDQLGEDRLWASLIADGHHLPGEVVKTFLRAKTPARCLLVSDLSGLAGSPPGRYRGDLCELEVLPDGRLVVAGQDQLLAGASRSIGAGIANVMAMAGFDLAAAVELATSQPLRLLQRPVPTIAAGEPADLVLFDLDPAHPERGLRVRETIIAGRSVWRETPA